jgi:benzoate/toluate 1,2-dioxygenase alpha subunit
MPSWLCRLELEWNDMCRGSKHWIHGPDDAANEIGLKPKLSGIKTEDEGLYLAQHQYWLTSMKNAIAIEKRLAAAQFQGKQYEYRNKK